MLKILEFQDDPVLRTDFELALTVQKMRTSPNQVLLVTEYIYFPHVLHAGEGHKPAINKASTYAAVYEKALASNISAPDFVSFVQKNGGITKIAREAAAQSKRQNEKNA